MTVPMAPREMFAGQERRRTAGHQHGRRSAAGPERWTTGTARRRSATRDAETPGVHERPARSARTQMMAEPNAASATGHTRASPNQRPQRPEHEERARQHQDRGDRPLPAAAPARALGRVACPPWLTRTGPGRARCRCRRPATAPRSRDGSGPGRPRGARPTPPATPAMTRSRRLRTKTAGAGPRARAGRRGSVGVADAGLAVGLHGRSPSVLVARPGPAQMVAHDPRRRHRGFP